MPFNAKAEDDVKASDPQTPLPKTRSKYVKNACTNCRKASRKCDDARPCPRCIKYALEDSCVSYVRRKRPEKKNGKNQKAIQKQKQKS
ncbi:hypothetical protein BCR43DRAFT_22569 [Syncephalastrum racemosum]|uniref:Zn(2)-C6 fungal-type domain-containing protein n=1 Tax=Syncephalastrum racemosum TaxID=13706 RepID=A0A1X2HT39_SYNRA|nr:hypothetical protein BCR43DRAFT_22569 [Syncephalastrum racemosum]